MQPNPAPTPPSPCEWPSAVWCVRPATAAGRSWHHSRPRPRPNSWPPARHGGCRWGSTPWPSGNAADAQHGPRPWSHPGLAGIIGKGPGSTPTSGTQPLSPRHGGHLHCYTPYVHEMMLMLMLMLLLMLMMMMLGQILLLWGLQDYVPIEDVSGVLVEGGWGLCQRPSGPDGWKMCHGDGTCVWTRCSPCGHGLPASSTMTRVRTQWSTARRSALPRPAAPQGKGPGQFLLGQLHVAVVSVDLPLPEQLASSMWKGHCSRRSWFSYLSPPVKASSSVMMEVTISSAGRGVGWLGLPISSRSYYKEPPCHHRATLPWTRVSSFHDTANGPHNIAALGTTCGASGVSWCQWTRPCAHYRSHWGTTNGSTHRTCLGQRQSWRLSPPRLT